MVFLLPIQILLFQTSMPVTLFPNDYSSLLFPDQPNQKPLSFFGCLTVNFWKTDNRLDFDTGICSGKGLGCGGNGSGVYFTNCHQLTPLVPRVQFDSMALKGGEEGQEVPVNPKLAEWSRETLELMLHAR